jgi:uncharacterized membrane protein YhaH (DUF805 family)
MERITRAIYWLGWAFVCSISVVAWSFFSTRPQIGLAVLMTAIPRLHDVGRSGWWSLGLFAAGIHVQTQLGTAAEAFPGSNLIAVILVGPLFGAIFVLGLLPGQPGANRFGAPSRLSR